MSETLSRKRYISECLACGDLYQAHRRHSITCSSACRVWLHRHPERRRILEEACRTLEIPVSLALQVKAIERLLPDLKPRLASGELSIEEAQAAAVEAYWSALLDTPTDRMG